MQFSERSCNQGVPIVENRNDEKHSIHEVLKHFSNGAFAGPTILDTLTIAQIRSFLNHNQHLIAQWNYWDRAHAVVYYGIERKDNVDYILFMDPGTGRERSEPHSYLVSNTDFRWVGSLAVCPSAKGYLCHCYNGEHDPHLGETGIDCGGPSCPPCPPPPPPPPQGNCSDCKWNVGEDEIDCGGFFCPPCEDLPEEIIIEDKTYSYNDEVKATKKITTKGRTIVQSGKRVSFITEETGSIALRPGFVARSGSNFSTQMKDLSEYSRICPETLCSNTVWARYWTCLAQALFLYDLLYAVKIEYEIYDIQNRFIYGDTKKITRNGKVGPLWNGTTGAIDTVGDVFYKLYCTIYYCNGGMGIYLWDFVYRNNKHCYGLPNPKSEEPEPPPQFPSPNPNNTPLHSATTPPQFTITPNPNPGTFHLQTNFPFTDIAHLKIITSIGATLYEIQTLSSPTIQLPTSATGQHFVVIMLKDGAVLTQKMVIQR